jgi:hypothetical protein
MDDLQEVRRVADEPPMTPEEQQQLRSRVMNGIKERERTSRPRLAAPKVSIPAAAAVLTVALVAGVTIFTNLNDSPQPADSGPSVLQEVAQKLDAQESAPIEIPQPEQWVYVKLTSENNNTGRMGEAETREDWTRADNSLVSFREPDGTLNTGDNEGMGIQPPLMGAFNDPAEMFEFLANLPSDDPAAVLEQIYARVDRSNLSITVACDEHSECEEVQKQPWIREGKAAMVIDELLRQTNPPPETQAILFRALDEIPSVTDAGTIKDITGKDVIAVHWSPPNSFENTETVALPVQYFILIDPETNLYRGQLTTSEDSRRDDKLVDSKIVVNHGIVDEPGQVP